MHKETGGPLVAAQGEGQGKLHAQPRLRVAGEGRQHLQIDVGRHRLRPRHKRSVGLLCVDSTPELPA
jgi:hypothetical protein